MNKEIIIRAQDNDIDIALLEDSLLVEFITNKTNTAQFLVGDIYLAKVKKIIPGLNAVFVDLGYEKDAFLHYHDLGPHFSSLNTFIQQIIQSKQIPTFSSFKQLPEIDKNGTIHDIIQPGQHILVQIAKEPISTKGPRLNSEISIAGRNIVLMPFSNKISISQKIESNEEKNRLKKILRSVVPQNYGVIVRTAAAGQDVAELEQEVNALVQKWEQTIKKIKKYKNNTPHLVMSEMNKVSALLRDIFNPDFNNIIVNNKEIYEEIREYILSISPDKEKIVKYYNAGPPIFEQFGVERQIKSSFGTTVPVKNGAYLIIEKTEALHVIDVNSGNRTKSDKDQETNAYDVNAAAALEIARQIRLRDLGGIVIVDFIDMKSNENKQKLYEVLRDAMLRDRAKHNILPLSKFGLMQITRQRVKPELKINTNEQCPVCNGSGHISPSINILYTFESDLKHIYKVLKIKHVTLRLHPILAGYITKGLFSILLRWKFQIGFGIHVQTASNMNYLEYEYIDKNNNIIIL
ncbi:MAG TPA: Rne/Rng family ribonuclease [Bacteroidales bacterium]|nr:Rne/Rng family ribonuclease [Bacteroidales bacterium]HRS19201.1 Rne/Rng family ribonuclease [Bacteroidales bacterium]